QMRNSTIGSNNQSRLIDDRSEFREARPADEVYDICCFAYGLRGRFCIVRADQNDSERCSIAEVLCYIRKAFNGPIAGCTIAPDRRVDHDVVGFDSMLREKIPCRKARRAGNNERWMRILESGAELGDYIEVIVVDRLRAKAVVDSWMR